MDTLSRCSMPSGTALRFTCYALHFSISRCSMSPRTALRFRRTLSKVCSGALRRYVLHYAFRCTLLLFVHVYVFRCSMSLRTTLRFSLYAFSYVFRCSMSPRTALRFPSYAFCSSFVVLLCVEVLYVDAFCITLSAVRFQIRRTLSHMYSGALRRHVLHYALHCMFTPRDDSLCLMLPNGHVEPMSFSDEPFRVARTEGWTGLS